MTEPQSYREFWPYYVGEHRAVGTRRLHFVGTTGVFAFLLLAIVTGNAWWLLAMPVVGYGFAWIGHLTVERNRPATFRYPFWSIVGDFHMYALMCLGRMDAEVDRYASRDKLA